ncbi:MAG: DUF4026 domain-containing protein [Polyangiaceae bacterium]
MLSFPESFLAGEREPSESTLLVLIHPEQPPPSADDVQDALDELGFEIDELREPEEPPEQGWALEFVFDPDLGGVQNALGGWMRLWLEPVEDDSYSDLEQRIDGEDYEDVRRARWQLGLSLNFGAEPLAAFHTQLRLLHALVPTPALVLDADAFAPRPAGWLRDHAQSEVPPSPTSLYSIHAVTGDEGDGVWLHTHGMLRSGYPDLDLLDVPHSDSSLGAELLARVAALFLEQSAPAAGDRFEIGKDLDLVWLTWEEALNHFPDTSVGGSRDREDDTHTGLRGVIVAPASDGYESIRRHLPTLRDNPLLYISHEETQRMALLASERLPRFLSLLTAYANDDAWAFLVKLGYPVAEGPEGGREHLWFQVHGLKDGGVDATLTNKPFAIALNPGDRGLHSLDHLTDWTIVCPFGRFDPDSVLNLERRLLRGATLN